jgi:two-component system alkaline phosphatase synthesis response regulator PhoP
MNDAAPTYGHRIVLSSTSSGRRPLLTLFVDADIVRPQALYPMLPTGTRVATVSSVQDALACIARQAPDLMVTDLDLPDGSGLELLNRVHRDPRTRHTLLMVMTSRAGIKDRIAAFEAGADDYVVRPVDPERFAVHVQLVSRFRQTLR